VFGIEMARSASVEGAKTFTSSRLEFNGEHMVIFLYLLALLLVASRCSSQPPDPHADGRAWEALREDEIACRSLGLNPRASCRRSRWAHVRRSAALSSRRARGSSTPNPSPSSSPR
jgi:ABC-type branched-subunit amino acid transport system permease subunit